MSAFRDLASSSTSDMNINKMVDFFSPLQKVVCCLSFSRQNIYKEKGRGGGAERISVGQ